MLSLESNVLLKHLDCSYNPLLGLNLSHNIELAELICIGNNLPMLDLVENKKLEILDCSYNNISSLHFSDSLDLVELRCNNNNLSVLSVNNFKLEFLDCSNNNLSELRCSGNYLSELKIDNNNSLVYLDCFDNNLQFSTLPILDSNVIYNYFPQKSIEGGVVLFTDSVDLSSEYNINGHITNYEWFDITSDGVEEPILQPENPTDGIFTFTLLHTNKRLKCKLTNVQFPALILEYMVNIVD
jgi:Leucine-rich repeat (LRR) protein